MNTIFLFNGLYFLSLCFSLTRFASCKKEKLSNNSMLPVEIFFLLSVFRNFILILNK